MITLIFLSISDLRNREIRTFIVMPFWMKSPDKGWILTWNYLLKFGQFGWNLEMVMIPLFIYVCLCSVRYRELRNLKLTFSTRNCIFYQSELGTNRPCLVLSRVNTSFCPNNMSPNNISLPSLLPPPGFFHSLTVLSKWQIKAHKSAIYFAQKQATSKTRCVLLHI